MIKLLGIDGLSIIRRVYEVAPDPKDADEIIKSSCQSIARAKYEANPNFSLLCVDYGGETWRHRLYPEYKANREPTPKLVRDIIPEIVDKVRATGFDFIMEPDVEADDVLASAAVQWVALSPQHTIDVVSTDKDLCVLMGLPRVRIRHHFDRIYRTEEWLQKKFGVSAKHISEALALIGDTSDNIPGVPLIGPVGAGYVLNKYGSIENALKHGDPSEHKAIKQLHLHPELARLSLKLTSLKTDIKINLPHFNKQEGLF